MLLNPDTCAFGASEYDETGPMSGTTSLTPGYSNAEAAGWTPVFAATARDSYELRLYTSGTAVTGVDAEVITDVAIGPGGSEQILIENLIVSKILTPNEFDVRPYRFPVFIPAGTRIAMRSQSSHTAGNSTNVMVLMQSPSRPEGRFVGAGVETIGAVTGSSGVGFTPGNSNSWGAYQLLAASTRRCRWWELGVSCSNASMTASLFYWFELAVGDGSSYDTILRMMCSTSSSERIFWCPGYGQGEAYDVPAGANLYVRGQCAGTADTGWNALAYGAY